MKIGDRVHVLTEIPGAPRGYGAVKDMLWNLDDDPRVEHILVKFEGTGKIAGFNPAQVFRCGEIFQSDPDIEAQVCDDVLERQNLGIAKYGVTVADNPLTHKQWLQHAYKECLDMAIYLKRSIEELK